MIDEVKAIISKITRIDKSMIMENSSLREDLWIDSLQAIQIVVSIEEEFNIKISEVEIFNVDTVMEVVELVEEYKGGKNDV
ncbi:MAG: hypothetical protein A2086_01455 [Spirochaetes bacterium GWD1_27_9]|nr:MAG: hypothetical protein A2Z98_01815 [Spirochaetes bacterium GWB1_27_13]OHD24440.1 MAG: hypothetical protein A2Y34_04170 [Spirochaetes bacterium GWC1_27_15]OHD36943.1 MAG: hypothetical protein A2086_01455 [Spirochaetes bacterium GWD1_27_9]